HQLVGLGRQDGTTFEWLAVRLSMGYAVQYYKSVFAMFRLGNVRLFGEQPSGRHFSSMSKVLLPLWMVVVMPEVSVASYSLGKGNHLLRSTVGAFIALCSLSCIILSLAFDMRCNAEEGVGSGLTTAMRTGPVGTSLMW